MDCPLVCLGRTTEDLLIFESVLLHARRALAELGVDSGALLPNLERSPSWPPGTTGTIAHASGCWAVAVTDSPGVLRVGLDLEPDTPLQSGLERLICTEDERSWVNQFNSKDRGGLYKVFFRTFTQSTTKRKTSGQPLKTDETVRNQ